MKRIGLVIATRLEAEPFFGEFGLEKVRGRPFPVYENREMIMVLTGVGPDRAFRAAGRLLEENDVRCLLNAGAAGALAPEYVPGDIFQVSTVEDAWGAVMKASPLGEFRTATLLTRNRAVLAARERLELSARAGLVDMEASGIVRAADERGVPLHIFKIVSDGHEQGSVPSVILNMIRYRKSLARFVADRVIPLLR